MFEPQTLLKMLYAKGRFYTVSMINGEKGLVYPNFVRHLAPTLKSMDVDIGYKEMAMAALHGLTTSYDSLTVGLDAIGNDSNTSTFDSV